MGGSETSHHFTYNDERVEGTPLPGGTAATFHAEYFDIVENQRIVFAYEMVIDRARVSVSLQTVELRATDEGTLLTLTEHGTFLDADGVGIREDDTRVLLDALGAALTAEASSVKRSG